MKNLSFFRKGPLKTWVAYCIFSKKMFSSKRSLPILLVLTCCVFPFLANVENVHNALLNPDKETAIFMILIVILFSAAIAMILYVSFLILLFIFAVSVCASDITRVAFSYRQMPEVLDGRDFIGGFFIKSRLKVRLSKVEYENFMGLKDSFNGSIKELMFVSRNV